MTAPQVVVYPDADVLAAACAARMVTTLTDVQSATGSASVVLTGGGIGIAVLDALRRCAARDAIDWGRLDVYWGDERFVPRDDGERNEKQAREALLDHVDVDPGRIHAMPPSDGWCGDDVGAAAAWYAEVLDRQARGEHRTGAPMFDLLLLGVGGEGHVASIFPSSPAARDTDHLVTAVRDCPKPPPTRVSLTLPAIRLAREVWIVTAGEAKADVLAAAYTGADEVNLPVAGARGRSRTRWLLDAGAASALPELDQTHLL
ncbi:6-phosphogluconolactonase [Haloechinothrix sp. LS1_15]|uniref:6-phosphogluconolactonase n=1 Tax=Haloechinothrix sp. LS1_15 TaxID=2652248 RepID=UPI002945D5A1|nr:6-phosphogluconolactonase [Haloechinothrix sp. LS1_15]MDV6013235.1 6-phosphogluconolactonase [Haloechinothrix sp. LS1_15]